MPLAICGRGSGGQITDQTARGPEQLRDQQGCFTNLRERPPQRLMEGGRMSKVIEPGQLCSAREVSCNLLQAKQQKSRITDTAMLLCMSSQPHRRFSSKKRVRAPDAGEGAAEPPFVPLVPPERFLVGGTRHRLMPPMAPSPWVMWAQGSR